MNKEVITKLTITAELTSPDGSVKHTRCCNSTQEAMGFIFDVSLLEGSMKQLSLTDYAHLLPSINQMPINED